MRLATFNILNGFSRPDRLVDPDRLAAAVRRLDPDVLALQEVDANQPRSHGLDLTAVAAEAMGAVAYRFLPALDGTPGMRWVAITGEPVTDHPLYGVSLLSRLPVREWDELRMVGAGPHFPIRVPGARRSVLVGEEPRVAILAALETPHGPLTVASTHLSFLPGLNVRQLRLVTQRLGRHAGPAVIMGDFNLPPPLPARITGFRALAAHRTFPAKSPRIQLDHILLRGDFAPFGFSEAVRMELSDHRALVVDLG